MRSLQTADRVNGVTTNSMSTTAVNPYETGFDDVDYASYRVLSRAAVLSLVLGILGLSGLLFQLMLLLPLVGFVSGLVALRAIRLRPDELTGRRVAQVGLALCAVGFGGGAAMHVIEYVTEVREGYRRTHWSELRAAGEKDAPPAEAVDLDGKDVFIKGYVHPSSITQKTGIKHFIMVPDMKTCCFGGQPKLTDMVEVTIPGEQSVDYSFNRRKLHGRFTVLPGKKQVEGLDGVYYQLEVHHVE